jgi:hypothetical protein|uniref:Uncharacterized protein n=1 Tax=viral metagenome TaxID=1070528 RepID=A0A6C0J2W9_9ZZZZ
MDNEYRMQNIIIDLVSTKDKLENYIIDIDNNNEIVELYKNIESYIEKNCVHNIISDYIDIDPEHCTNITYCDICMKTFE